MARWIKDIGNHGLQLRGNLQAVLSPKNLRATDIRVMHASNAEVDRLYDDASKLQRQRNRDYDYDGQHDSRDVI